MSIDVDDSRELVPSESASQISHRPERSDRRLNRYGPFALSDRLEKFDGDSVMLVPATPDWNQLLQSIEWLGSIDAYWNH